MPGLRQPVGSRDWGLNICYLGIRRVSDLCRWKKTGHLALRIKPPSLVRVVGPASRVVGERAPLEMQWERGRALQIEETSVKRHGE